MSESKNEQIDGEMLMISSTDLQKNAILIYSVMSLVNGKLTCLRELLPLSADTENLTQVLNECSVSLQIGVDKMEELFTKFSAPQDNLKPGVIEESKLAESQNKSTESLTTPSEEDICQTETSCSLQQGDTTNIPDPLTSSVTITSDTELLNMSYDDAVDVFLNRGYANGHFRPDAWRQCIRIISERLRRVDTLIDYAEQIYNHCKKTGCRSCQFNEYQDGKEPPVCLLYYPERYWDIEKLKQIKERKEEQESE